MYSGPQPKRTGREDTRILYCLHCDWRREELLSEATLAFQHGHSTECKGSIWFVEFEDPAEREAAEKIVRET